MAKIAIWEYVKPLVINIDKVMSVNKTTYDC